MVPVLILKQLASFVVTGDDPEQARTVSEENLATCRWWLANKAIVIRVYAFPKTLNDGAKPKAY